MFWGCASNLLAQLSAVKMMCRPIAQGIDCLNTPNAQPDPIETTRACTREATYTTLLKTSQIAA